MATPEQPAERAFVAPTRGAGSRSALNSAASPSARHALLLGLPRRTLVLRIKEYGIERKKDRREA